MLLSLSAGVVVTGVCTTPVSLELVQHLREGLTGTPDITVGSVTGYHRYF